VIITLAYLLAFFDFVLVLYIFVTLWPLFCPLCCGSLVKHYYSTVCRPEVRPDREANETVVI